MSVEYAALEPGYETKQLDAVVLAGLSKASRLRTTGLSAKDKQSFLEYYHKTQSKDYSR